MVIQESGQLHVTQKHLKMPKFWQINDLMTHVHSSLQYCRSNNPLNTQFRTPSATPGGTAVTTAAAGGGGGKTMGRWLKERREKKKEETRAHNA